MKSTGIFVTKEELDAVRTAYKVSGILLNGKPMGDPEHEVQLLVDKYKPPKGAGLSLKTGEFVV